MKGTPLDRKARIAIIARILREEGVADWLHYELGVTLEGEAAALDIVCQKDREVESILGLLLGIADGDEREQLEEAARRIFAETG